MNRLKELENDLGLVIEQREKIDNDIKEYQETINRCKQKIAMLNSSDYHYYLQEKEILNEIKALETIA